MPRLAHKRVVEIDEESSEIAAVETSITEVPHSESETSEFETSEFEASESETFDVETTEISSAEAASADIAPPEAIAGDAELTETSEPVETSDLIEVAEVVSAEAPEVEASAAEMAVAGEPEMSASEETALEEVSAADEGSSAEAAARKSSSSESSPSTAAAPDADVAPNEPSEQAAARPEELRLLEALLFASSEPLDQSALGKRMPDGVDVKAALAQLQADYALRGVNLVRIGNKWTFRTANDLSWLMTRESTETRRLSRAAIEVLAIIAYHQPVTRAEIEDIRGVVTSKGTLDVLLETGWIRPRGRRKTPGRPLTFGTTESFLSQFSLEALGDLPGLEELKGTGLLDSRLPSGFSVPAPSDDPALREDEDPLEPGDLDLSLAPAVEPEKPGEE